MKKKHFKYSGTPGTRIAIEIGMLSFLSIVLCLQLMSCQKDFLDKKPDQSLLVPATLGDFQAILNNNVVMNAVPYLDMVSTDDIYTTDAGYAGAGYLNQNSYIWAKDIYEGQTDYDWDIPYTQVFYSNVILDGLQKIKRDSSTGANYDQIKGTALFFRAFAFYSVAQEFTEPYNPATAGKTPGIPIRLSSDVNEKSNRGTLNQTYAQIVIDLQTAAGLLPANVSFVTQPTKAAAFGMLARVYQTMQSYSLSKDAATASLNLDNTLMDYNLFSTSATRPFPKILPANANSEVLFYSPLISNASFLISPTLTLVDSTLYNSYDPNDLRRSMFFKKGSGAFFLFRGNYSNGANVFAGVATDEVYLIRAEAYARLGDASSAMDDLNTLLQKRWKTGTYTALVAGDADAALSLIVQERRKELVYRNLRWTDLKRLNQDPRFAVTITRVINGTTYTLAPGDNRYAFPIPQDEIARSGIAQNPQ